MTLQHRMIYESFSIEWGQIKYLKVLIEETTIQELMILAKPYEVFYDPYKIYYGPYNTLEQFEFRGLCSDLFQIFITGGYFKPDYGKAILFKGKYPYTRSFEYKIRFVCVYTKSIRKTTDHSPAEKISSPAIKI